MRLLVVSSSKVFRRSIANALREQKHLIEEVASGLGGLHVGGGRAFDMVLLDSELHDITGLDFVAQFRASADADVPFLYFAAHGTYQDVLGAFDMGVDDYILIPFDASMLQRKLEKQARNHRDRIRKRRLALPAVTQPGKTAVPLEVPKPFVSVPDAAALDDETVEQSKPRKYVRKDAFSI